MRIAFYAPMKPPTHPVPSGDRRMARSFMALLADLGHEVRLASRFRSYDGHGDPERQARLAVLGGRLARRLLRRLHDEPPDLWFTYHLYHKSPDWLGPPVCDALGIPYVVAEASIALKRASGPWAMGYSASRAAIARADRVLVMTSHDLPALRPVVRPERLVLFPPFLDTRPFAVPSGASAAEMPVLLAVAMMRADVKRDSYGLLAAALSLLAGLPWRLEIVGDGEASEEIAWMFAAFGGRVRMHGAVPSADLPPIYAAADIYVWPALDEAYGMALLEAQAAGLPVVAGREGGVPDVVDDGVTGLLTEPRSVPAFAAAVRSLLLDPARRRAMGAAASKRVLTHHSLPAARTRLSAALADLRTPACASA